MSTNITAPAEAPALHFGFLLVPNFTLLAFSAAIEPLRMANQRSGKTLYRWSVITEFGDTVQASDGMRIEADFSLVNQEKFDAVYVCGGIDVEKGDYKNILRWLNRQALAKVNLGGICTGSYLLAAAGLLDGYTCTIHWEYLASWAEQFHRIESSDHLYCIDRNRFTCSGGTAPMDMMLEIIARDHNRALSELISEAFVYDRIRDSADIQRIPLKHRVGHTSPKLQDVVALMEANIEEAISLDELAAYVQLSRRQLERLFQQHLGCTPSRYYMNTCLFRARQLLKQSRLSITEVASVCGFTSTQHFSAAYRKLYGLAPRNERRGLGDPK